MTTAAAAYQRYAWDMDLIDLDAHYPVLLDLPPDFAAYGS